MAHFVSLAAAALVLGMTASALAAESQVERGEYLVTVMGCGDCHTPGYFLGKPDFAKNLAGSDVGFTIPGLGAFYGRNLTPDKQTGLGNWTTEQIIIAITTGVRPDGRKLAPIMPYEHFAHLKPDDAQAIAAYLKSLPPVDNAIPGPFGPGEAPKGLVFVIVPGEVYAKLQKH